MVYDIIDLDEREVKALTVVQLKMLRTAQQSKNKLQHEMEQDLLTYKLLLYTDGMENSNLYDAKYEELKAEFDYQVAILKEQLIFNMGLNEPTTDDELGDNGSDNETYIVDYSLSYLERYIAVRDYYMNFHDPYERLALYAADKVAVKYLGSYYNTLYNYFAAFTN
jgi:hypothetical protein